MKYLKKFDNHTDYEAAESGLILPNVSWCVQENEVHFGPMDKRLIAKYNITDISQPTTLVSGYSPTLFKSLEIDDVGYEWNYNNIRHTFDTIGEHTVKFELTDETVLNSNGQPVFLNAPLVSVTIPETIITIGVFYFYGCSGLTSINIPDSVTTIGDYAFQGCIGLTSLNISKNVTSIGGFSFNGCYNLTDITVDSENAIYDSRNNCNAIIETSTNTLMVACDNTIIPNSVTSIYNSVYLNHSGLTSIVLPENITSIGTHVFNGCTNLDSITCNATTAPAIRNTTFQYIKSGGILYVPKNSTGYDIWMQSSAYYLGNSNWTKVEI